MNTKKALLKKFIDQKQRIIINDLDIRPGEKVLDVGFGDGEFSEIAARLGAEVHATDINTPRLKDAEKVLRDQDLNVTCQVADVRKMPFPDNHFDKVFFLAVLPLVPFEDRNKAISEVIRVTKPGGAIYFSSFNKFRIQLANIFKGTFTKRFTVRKKTGRHIFGYSKKEIMRMLRKEPVMLSSLMSYHPFNRLLLHKKLFRNRITKKPVELIEDFFAKYLKFWSIYYLFKLKKK
ncbi:class I SAM-dependent methyltransferase [Candidatus Woesearchaeota archaeon]|nr:class I SAM-dependent methyltransferase [Candidatus Woesearchaeota archaeon]MBW2994237.1 class I SAM-dependent methyltransferase [Candidatus Woesearchaeota archaeon]